MIQRKITKNGTRVSVGAEKHFTLAEARKENMKMKTTQRTES